MTTYTVVCIDDISIEFPDLADMVGGHSGWLVVQSGPDCSEIIESCDSKSEAESLARRYRAQERS